MENSLIYIVEACGEVENGLQVAVRISLSVDIIVLNQTRSVFVVKYDESISLVGNHFAVLLGDLIEWLIGEVVIKNSHLKLPVGNQTDFLKILLVNIVALDIVQSQFHSALTILQS